MKNKTIPSFLLLASFAIITLSQVGFIFIRLSDIFYPVSEVIQLIGYIGLLVTFIMVLKSGKKKNTD
jgi:hypothetical protein